MVYSRNVVNSKIVEALPVRTATAPSLLWHFEETNKFPRNLSPRRLPGLPAPTSHCAPLVREREWFEREREWSRRRDQSRAKAVNSLNSLDSRPVRATDGRTLPALEGLRRLFALAGRCGGGVSVPRAKFLTPALFSFT